MGMIEAKLAALGLALPAQVQVPPGVAVPFAWVRVRVNRALVSGRVALNPDGTIVAVRGKVGETGSVEQSYHSARQTALAMLGSLNRTLGGLDRAAACVRVFGMVNTGPGFDQYPSVVNGFSDLILELYGPERGAHARSAVGVAGLPFNIAVEAEVEVAGG